MAGVDAARVQARAVLRVRGLALAAAALPAGAAVVLLAGRLTGRLGAPGAPDAAGWDAARWVLCWTGAVTLAAAAAVAVALSRVRPLSTPTVAVSEPEAPELYGMIRELADRMDVPAPAAVALVPDCDSWLEEQPGGGADGRLRRFRRPDGGPGVAWGAAPRRAPVLVLGSPFLWWMRVAELRALLAPVVAGTAAAADPEIAAARRFVRALGTAVAAARRLRDGPSAGPEATALPRRSAVRALGRLAGVLLRACRSPAERMERAVAAWASEHAQAVDYGLRVAAQEQVGLAYAGWDRLLTRVALPAWRIGRWPARLDAGVAAALTELSRRDRMVEGFETRLTDRPACDLLEEPGRVDEAASLLAARLFHGVPESPGGGSSPWLPVAWEEYPEQVVGRVWREQAAALLDALDRLDPGPGDRPGRVGGGTGPALARVLECLHAGDADRLAAHLAARSAAAHPRVAEEPACPLRTPPGDRDLLVEHVTSMVCCAAVETAGSAPGLDWLDGPALLVDGSGRWDPRGQVASAVESGDDAPLRAWLDRIGVHLGAPVRMP